MGLLPSLVLLPAPLNCCAGEEVLEAVAGDYCTCKQNMEGIAWMDVVAR